MPPDDTYFWSKKSRKTQTRNCRLINETFSFAISSDPKKHALCNHEHVVICQLMTHCLDTGVCYK